MPGDVVKLAAGDLVPADARLINARDLFVNQALLTGEPYPAEKHACDLAGETAQPGVSDPARDLLPRALRVSDERATDKTGTLTEAIMIPLVRSQSVRMPDRVSEGAAARLCSTVPSRLASTARSTTLSSRTRSPISENGPSSTRCPSTSSADASSVLLQEKGTTERLRSTTLIERFMLVFGPVSSVFDFLTFFVLLRLLGADAAQFQTGWFVESLATQALVIFVIRTRDRFWRSHPHPN